MLGLTFTHPFPFMKPFSSSHKLLPYFILETGRFVLSIGNIISPPPHLNPVLILFFAASELRSKKRRNRRDLRGGGRSWWRKSVRFTLPLSTIAYRYWFQSEIERKERKERERDDRGCANRYEPYILLRVKIRPFYVSARILHADKRLRICLPCRSKHLQD